MSKKFSADEINSIITENIFDILDHFGVEYRNQSRSFSFKCPIHGSSGYKASMDLDKMCWSCWSGLCHEEYGRSMFGLLKGILDTSENDDNVYGFISGMDFTCKAIKKRIIDLDPKKLPIIDSLGILRGVDIPSKYYALRGFRRPTLSHFKIGEPRVGKNTYRVSVPIWDASGRLVGASFRTKHPKCKKCSQFHVGQCPSREVLDKYSIFYQKWIHTKGFSSANVLYNIHGFKGQKKVAIVESPKNVWRLHESDIFGMAVFGASMSEQHARMLEKIGIKELLILSDNDKAGDKFKQKTIEKFHNRFGLHSCKLSKNDVADLTVQEVKDTIGKIWHKI